MPKKVKINQTFTVFRAERALKSLKFNSDFLSLMPYFQPLKSATEAKGKDAD